MENIFKILNRLNYVYVKRRVLLLFLIVQNTILSLVILIFANVIISNGKINGELDYSQIRLFYNVAIVLLFILILILAPILLSREMNGLYKKNIIEHLLSVKIEIRDIVYAVYFRGLATLIVLLVSAFPIIVISFYFGGFSLVKIFRLMGMVLSFAVLFSAVCIFISARLKDENASIIVSYVAGIALTLINIYFLNVILNGGLLVIAYVIINIVLSLILVSISKKTTLFNA